MEALSLQVQTVILNLLVFPALVLQQLAFLLSQAQDA
jgi:hypothetical protein